MKQSEKIVADIRRLKKKRCGINHAIDALETLCVEALLLEAGYSRKDTAEIIKLYDTLERKSVGLNSEE